MNDLQRKLISSSALNKPLHNMGEKKPALPIAGKKQNGRKTVNHEFPRKIILRHINPDRGKGKMTGKK